MLIMVMEPGSWNQCRKIRHTTVLFKLDLIPTFKTVHGTYTNKKKPSSACRPRYRHTAQESLTSSARNPVRPSVHGDYLVGASQFILAFIGRVEGDLKWAESTCRESPALL